MECKISQFCTEIRDFGHSPENFNDPSCSVLLEFPLTIGLVGAAPALVSEV